MKLDKKELFSIPNILTFMRLPLAILVMLYSDYSIKYLFLSLAISFDWLDGFVARRFNMATKLGAILDPLFDKIFVVMLFFFFFFKLGLPAYLVLMFFTRDIVTATSSVIFLAKKLDSGIEIKARFFGKVVTFSQFFVLMIIVAEKTSWVTPGIQFVFAVTLCALVDYGHFFYSQFKPQKQWK